MKLMEKEMEKIINEDIDLHRYGKNVPIILKIKYKDEIILSYKNNIQFYTNDLNKKNEIILDGIIKDFFINDNDYLLLAISNRENRKLIIYKRDNIYQYSKLKEKIIYKIDNIEQYSKLEEILLGLNMDCIHLIELNDKDLIGYMTRSEINIIDINSLTVISKFLLSKNDFIDNRTKPVLMSDNIICFKQQQMLVIFNYKKMKIIKTINFNNNNYPFQIYKDKNQNYFYIVSLFYEKKIKKGNIYIETIKYDKNIEIIERSKNFFESVKCLEEYYDHYCIYNSIVENINNYNLILHGHYPPPYDSEWFLSLNCINGKIGKIKTVIDDNVLVVNEKYEYSIIKNEDKIISAYARRDEDEIHLSFLQVLNNNKKGITNFRKFNNFYKRKNLNLKIIFVGGLPNYINNRRLFSLFRNEGRIRYCKVIFNRIGISKGYGFIEFINPRDAFRAIRKWNNTYLGKNIIRVEYSKRRVIKKKLFGKNNYGYAKTNSKGINFYNY